MDFEFIGLVIFLVVMIGHVIYVNIDVSKNGYNREDSK